MVEAQANTTSEKAATTTERPGAPERKAESERRSYQQDNDGHGAADNGGRGVARGTAARGHDAVSAARQAAFPGAHLWSRSLGPFYTVQMEMMRWLDDLWRETTGGLRPAQPSRAWSIAPLVGLPPADVKETDQAYTLCVELPGLAKDDVDLSIQHDMLILTGHKAEEREEANAAYRLSERRFGRFERSFPLPPDVIRGQLDATFRDGVLKIVLPRDGQLSAQGHAQIPIHG